MFATPTEALDWLQALYKHRARLDPDLAIPEVHTAIADAVRYVASLRFDDTPIEHALIAQAAGILPEVVEMMIANSE